MTTTTEQAAAARLATLTAEDGDLERRENGLERRLARAGTAAELEEAGRRLAAGEPVEDIDVQGELRRVRSRRAVIAEARKALTTRVQSELLAAAEPGLAAAHRGVLALVQEEVDAMAALEAVQVRKDAALDKFDRRVAAVAPALDAHPGRRARFPEYVLTPLRYGPGARFRRDPINGNDLDRHIVELRAVGLDVKARPLAEGVSDPARMAAALAAFDRRAEEVAAQRAADPAGWFER